MLVGFAAGVVPVALVGLGASAPGGEVAGVAAGYGGIGLLIGLLVDTFTKDKALIYVRGADRSFSRIRVVPALFRGAAVHISLEF
jgi:hypothetical protein